MPKSRKSDEMAPEYDFSKGVRGKYADRLANGSNTALFPNSDSVNPTLRLVAKLRKAPVKAVRRRKRSSVKVVG